MVRTQSWRRTPPDVNPCREKQESAHLESKNLPRRWSRVTPGEVFSPTLHIVVGGNGVLTAHELEIVRSDWEKVERIADRAATLLYDRLFAIDPEVRMLFPLDMQEQKTKVMGMLGAAIYGLDDPDVLVPILRQLGRKHLRFGVRDHHYAALAGALNWTLRQGLGEAFDLEHAAAWNHVFAVLAEHMWADDPGDQSDV
jgi:hemoglobin-like flavoprotein